MAEKFVPPVEVPKYQARHPIRMVTAASLFDGHDAAINMIRRLLQDSGVEVIHLGHNRSVQEVVEACLQESVQGVCVSSYQGGHMEYFKYMKDLLAEKGASHVQIFGGGGGVIIHEEKAELEKYGIAHIFHPDDGRRLGLQGMINLILEKCDFDPSLQFAPDPQALAKAGSVERNWKLTEASRELGHLFACVEKGLLPEVPARYRAQRAPLVLGITGTGGAGKSSLIDEILQRFLNVRPELKIGVFCVDPSKRKTGGSLLGDRIRMNSLGRLSGPGGVFMRSIASRGSGREIAQSLPAMLKFARQLNFDFIIAETSGIGQGNMAITEVSDLSLYVMTSDFGAQSQLEKIDMLDFADLVAINKSDRRGSSDALRDVTKQYKRSRKIFDAEVQVPVYLTQASRFNDRGVNSLFLGLIDLLEQRQGNWKLGEDQIRQMVHSEEFTIIPPERQNYLAEIVSTIRSYKARTRNLEVSARKLGALDSLAKEFSISSDEEGKLRAQLSKEFTAEELAQLHEHDQLRLTYQKDEMSFQVRGKSVQQSLKRKTLSGSAIPKVSVPDLPDWGLRWRYQRLENVPGRFPFTAGVFPLKRVDEDPKRMFAGEGTPDRTNRRFHYLCQGEKAQRLSTAFDSVTLYGFDPATRPDIFGKVGESGVSVCSLEDMKKLYAGFDLCHPNTSVSMTINGPAPMILAFFFNTAIDQQIEKKEKSLGRSLNAQEKAEVEAWTLTQVRGTVQADILKEDQGQNTCIFSIQFALKMMGDIQQFFIERKIQNFYSVSISGYHIAEAGANPISQLAFTLSNGFSFVEYYLARGMKVDEFAQNLSFFFSNGLDAEYTVLGRVARRIWAVAMRELYAASERAQKLKYHIQTSGRSLHAQEIAFNDIRTTLQALVALSDNCNSLHTNAYDEAITTPTEESVRRAMAIQLIINKEFGWMMNENPIQGSYFIEELTELVEEAVLDEFVRLNERGGVLGAMETQYQRSKIQEESMHYEHLKHNGELPIIGVNTFVDPQTLANNYVPPKIELARASQSEKNHQLEAVQDFQRRNQTASAQAVRDLKEAVLRGDNIFAQLMKAARVCSLQQMTDALFEVGGQYRRNL